MKHGLLVALLVGVVGLIGLAKCPEAGLPVVDVKPGGPGGYLILVHNDRACSISTIKLVFKVDVKEVKAFAIQGPAVASIEGKDRVWTIKLAGSGLGPGRHLVVGIAGVSPAVEPECEALVRYVFPSPPICR